MSIYLPASPFFEEGEYSEWEIKNLKNKWKDNAQAMRIIDEAINPNAQGLIAYLQAETKPSELLTDEQVENWRGILYRMFGPFALFVTREQIQAFRDKMQTEANKLGAT